MKEFSKKNDLLNILKNGNNEDIFNLFRNNNDNNKPLLICQLLIMKK